MRSSATTILLLGALAGCSEHASPTVGQAPTGTLAASRTQYTRQHDAARSSQQSTAADWFLASYSPPTPGSSAPFDDRAPFVLDDPSGATVDDSARVRRASRHHKPLPGLWQTIGRDLRAAPDDLWEDTKSVYANGPNLVILGLTYGGSLAMQETSVDRSVEDSIGDGRIYSNDLADTFGALGNPALHFGVAGLWYLVGQQRQDERTYEVGKTLFSALAINGVTVMLGQAASGDHAPNGERGTFPSGHTSSTFTFASVMHEAYGPWVGAPLYAVGVAVAAERIDDREHYLSDVVMGAVMGLVIGHSVAGEHELELFGGEIVPYVDPGTGAQGIAWHVSF